MISASVQHDPQKILMACRYAARRSGANDLCAILGKFTDNPETPTKIRKLLDSKLAPVIRLETAEQALVFLFDNSLSKNVYTNMRLESKACGADIWPPYNELRALKTECRKKLYPFKKLKLAKVSIQSLLDHTSERLVKLQKEVILEAMQIMNCTVMDVVLLYSSELDGSTGHSVYKQLYSSVHEVNIQDSDLLATVLIPLRLINKDNTILWTNRASQSARFCRPIKFQYVKESVEIIIREKKNIDEQIDNLRVFNISIDENHCIRIHYAVFFTLIDGKVLNAITNTKSMQACPICHATPRQFNDLSNKMKEAFLPDSKSLVYGISSLHAWIWLLECCLHISYRIDIKVWQVRGDKLKVAFADRKKRVQAILWERLGLIVDRPKPGGFGTMNGGNTARRAFKNPILLAECLGLHSELLKNIQTILIALSCHMPIDPPRFDALCSRTAEIYVTNYPMPSTVYKILIHGADILRTSILPVGMLGEEASEARNKDYKNFRLFHSRKTSRKDTLKDLFYRVMDTSDPIISSMSLTSRINKKKILVLPREVLDLLAISEKETTSNFAADVEVEIVDEDDTEISQSMLLDDVELSDEELEEEI